MSVFNGIYNYDEFNEELNGNIDACNTELFNELAEFLKTIVPVQEKTSETIWAFFYIPITFKEKIQYFPVKISNFMNKYNLSFQEPFSCSSIDIKEGDEKPSEFIKNVVKQIKLFTETLKSKGEDYIYDLNPYEWRTGVIKRQYTAQQDKLISVDDALDITKKYNKHLEKNIKLESTTVNKFLKTAAIMYKSAFASKIEKFPDEYKSDKKLNKAFADGRHGGMQFIEDWDSEEAFMKWLKSDEWKGAHPFEIVYSTPHGIYLYPPQFREEDDYFYEICVADNFYIPDYFKMLQALIENNIPFRASGFEKDLKYYQGEETITVNSPYGWGDNITYKDTDEDKEKYFEHITWRKLPCVKLKDA